MKSKKIKQHIKVLEVHDDYFIGAKGYKLYKYHFSSHHYEYFARLEDSQYALFSRFFLTSRLLRAEITNLYTLPNGDQFAIAKKAIFRCMASDNVFSKCFDVPRGSKPLNLCILPNGHIYLGEYFQNLERNAVNIYGSFDNGESWKAVYSFADGEINHIHRVVYDEYTSQLWVVTGDKENECIIGYTEDEFQTFIEVFRGGQEYRTCHLFFYRDFIVFATDSQYIQNEVKYFDRKTFELKLLTTVQGSVIKGGQSGNVSFLATTVEPSDVNTGKSSHLWYTKDGQHWIDAISYKKDRWPAIFQFGTIEFPNYNCLITDKLWYSGRALKSINRKSAYIKI
jgi:hypothetical protein